MEETLRGRVRRVMGGGRSGGSGSAPPDRVIVCERGRWSATPLDSTDVRRIELDEVAGLAAKQPRRKHSISDSGIEIIEPVSPLALPVSGDLIGIVPPDSRTIEPLHLDELRLLDALDRIRSCTDIADELGLPLAAIRAAAERLDALGAITRRANGTPVEPVAPTPIDAADDLRTEIERLSAPRSLGERPLHPLDPERIPVIAVHIPRFGAPLAAGMLLAYARAWQDGALNGSYELRPMVTVDEAELLLERHDGPAVLLCSNYIWSHRENLDLAARMSERNANLLVVHGGPHTPKYEGEQEEFLDRPGVHVAVVGEGEHALVELLAALEGVSDLHDYSVLRGVSGVVFRDPRTGELVRGPARERSADLDVFPSPYLSGEFDEIHPATWDPQLGSVTTFETNRGCPYKCAFCDWGSATMSRIRKFSMDRVIAEMDWMADRGLSVWMVTDANFGMLPRDVAIAEHIVDLHRRTGLPHVWGVNTAKNTTRNLSKIISMLSDEGITVVSSLALQTRDEETLRVINRENISTDKYDELAATFRRQRLPLLCDLIVGLPGATVQSFKADLQWCFDHEITPRAWVCQVLPNAPMNDPEYRERFQLEMDEFDVVVASSTFSRADRAHMMGLRMAERLFEHMGLLRHVLRVVQWERGVPAFDVLDRVVEITRRFPERYPFTSWALNHMDCFLMPPMGWGPFYDEIARFLRDELDIQSGADLATAFAVQRAVMPDRRRSFPSSVSLPHDYVSYYRDATAQLHRNGKPTGPVRPLADYPAARFDVWGDPAGLGADFKRLYEVRPPDLLPGEFWHISHFELDSPLTRWVNEVRATAGYTPSLHAVDFEEPDDDYEYDGASRQTGPTPVVVALQQRAASDTGGGR